MAPQDVEKTAFRTPIDNFYYTVMPFGLKNACAIYQRSMTAIFHDMIHRELEDYVDDIVVKSKKREEHIQVLRRVFERCRTFKLRMNPLKCAFGVSSGKFLGFLVYSRGIDVDLGKATAIVAMKPPATVKELKSFLGKVSYIRRFIPGLASITSAFGKLLKKGRNFEWGEVQQAAFNRLQQIMINLPTVQAPVRKKPLLLYLATNQCAMGALITQEDGNGVEQPVYYISRALKDTETCYLRAERACLAIVYASQRLRHYFLAYEVWLMTKSHAIKALLRQPILSGKKSQWLLQLSQYNLKAGTPKAVKSQAIADLLAQFPGEEEFSLDDGVLGEVATAEEVGEQWLMKFDRSSTAQSGGVRVVLYHEENEAITLSFKLKFPCLNNTAEYEAYLTGLAKALEMGVKHLKVVGDSNLVVCQTKGSFSLKEPSLAPYRAMAQKIEERFSTFEIEHASRGENRFANALATLGSQIIFEGNSAKIEVNKRRESIIEVLKENFQEEQCEEDWRNPIREVLIREGEPAELKALKDYTLVGGELYRRMLGGILSRCIGQQEAQRKLKEMHEKTCGKISLYRRLQRAGFYWPSMGKDADQVQVQCETCRLAADREESYAMFASEDWREPFTQYLAEGVLPQKHNERYKLKRLVTRYFLHNTVLFKK
ncbi:uncharacterized protein LOC142640120 [Castanea sativa]|uniref:uncharacterized protein LOC142640120 n=1 Tax=Castanea sativa TaxID=21020 RepID=UPI003F64C331